MPRHFNTAGPCDPADHFTLSALDRLPDVAGLVADKKYFVLHAPRQSGKTTAMRTLASELTATGQYAALHASCEAGAAFPHAPDKAERLVAADVVAQGLQWLPEALRPPANLEGEAGGALANLLQRWSSACPLPVVLFLDEIDALQDEALISVLRQIRAGYPGRPRGFPHSLALIGLRDVRDYKVQSGGMPHLGTASPFNIKAESLTLAAFSHDDVAELYSQHTAETGQRFTDEAVARAFELTQGQPWLVNALAYDLTYFKRVPVDTTITVHHIDEAKERLIVSRQTHLDSLADKLREDRVRRVIEPILVAEMIPMSVSRDDLEYCIDLGLVRQIRGAPPEIANPIYREVLPRDLAMPAADRIILPERPWTLADGRLDVDGLMAAFVDFWRENAEIMVHGMPYAEPAAQLVLMAFMQRVVNGGGTIDREYALGTRRIDLCIRWPYAESGQRREQRIAFELKVWRDKRKDPLVEGLVQLEAYLARLSLDWGFLVLFDQRSAADEVPWEERPRWESATTASGRSVRVLRL